MFSLNHRHSLPQRRGALETTNRWARGDHCHTPNTHAAHSNEPGRAGRQHRRVSYCRPIYIFIYIILYISNQHASLSAVCKNPILSAISGSTMRHLQQRDPRRAQLDVAINVQDLDAISHSSSSNNNNSCSRKTTRQANLSLTLQAADMVK